MEPSIGQPRSPNGQLAAAEVHMRLHVADASTRRVDHGGDKLPFGFYLAEE
jgi:hypothetical protein